MSISTISSTEPDTTPSTNLASPRNKPLINRNFALLWSGQTISLLGDFIFTATIAVWVGVILARGQSWAALAVSGVLAAAALPSLLLAPLAGVFVDRWDKRLTMIIMDAIRAIAVLAVLIIPFLATHQWPLLIQLLVVYGVVFFVNSCDQFFRPAMLALINDLVPEQSQSRAIGMGQVSVSLAAIVGPPVATLVLFAAGMQWALCFNALSFVISCLTILVIHVPRGTVSGAVQNAPEHNLIREFLAGIAFFFHNQVLRTLTIAIVIALLGGGAFQALDLFFVTQNLHTPAAYYGFLETAQGLGMLLGAVLASIFTERLGLTRVIWSSLLIMGLLALVYGRLTSFLPAIVLLFLIGIPLAALSVASGPLVLRVTPRNMIGRTAALLTPITTLAGMLAAIIAGYLDSNVLHSFHAIIFDQHFGATDTIFAGAGLLALLGGIYALVGLRNTWEVVTENSLSTNPASARS